jgi:hypothetical protein
MRLRCRMPPGAPATRAKQSSGYKPGFYDSDDSLCHCGVTTLNTGISPARSTPMQALSRFRPVSVPCSSGVLQCTFSCCPTYWV